ncbi:MAG: DUF4367 domain-containing protein [Chloroflexi bacterium]|nr:DUF4367 domain-containing protein [Chloroflexota bacterium]
MDKQTIQSILQDALEEQIPSAEIDLWRAVEQGLVAGTAKQQGVNMNTTQPRRIPRAAFALIIMAILLALTFITPQGRAFAQSILRFFIRSSSDSISVPTAEPYRWITTTPGAPLPTSTPRPAEAAFAAECGDFSNPTCSVEQIRGMVNFPVKELGKIPEGFYLAGATGGPDSVILTYYYEEQNGSITITIERWTGAPSSQSDLVGSSAEVEKVQVGSIEGEYFKGVFAYEDGSDTATWDPDFGNETLRWVDGDVSYTILYFYPPIPMGKEGMVALAETMTTEVVEKLPTPTPGPFDMAWDPRDMYNLGIPEAEEKAGFTLLLPTRLPDIFILIGAHYEEENNTVWVYYQLDPNRSGDTSNGLVLREQSATNPEDSALGDIIIGDYNTLPEGNPENLMVVPADARLETVQIGDNTGKYIEGVWSGTDCCGWQWDPMPCMKTLRWWANGRAFELTYTGTELQKEDLLSIAASIQ